MSRKEKLLASILANTKTVRYEEACKLAILLGFHHKGGKGSHRVFKRTGELVQLNFQNRGEYIPPYQARQLVEMIEKYGEQL